jgi:hypothetical protein
VGPQNQSVLRPGDARLSIVGVLYWWLSIVADRTEGRPVNKIFLGFSFRPENERVVRDIDRLVQSHGLVLVTGEILGGAGLTPEIQRRIAEADALVALLTREEKIDGQEAWRPTGWVNTEYISARARRQCAIALVEDSVKVDGAYAESEHIRIDRQCPCEAMVRLSETIGLWKFESGRSLEIRLLPEAAATLAASEGARCEYRVVRPMGSAPPWQEGRAHPKPGGVFLIIPGVRQDEAIEVRIMEGNTARWRSVESPQWVHIELKSIA